MVSDLADIKLGQDIAKLRSMFLNGLYTEAKQYIQNRLMVST